MEIEIHKGELTWTPKTVIYNGTEYPAPLDLLPILTRQIMIEVLTERKNERNKFLTYLAMRRSLTKKKFLTNNKII